MSKSGKGRSASLTPSDTSRTASTPLRSRLFLSGLAVISLATPVVMVVNASDFPDGRAVAESATTVPLVDRMVDTVVDLVAAQTAEPAAALAAAPAESTTTVPVTAPPTTAPPTTEAPLPAAPPAPVVVEFTAEQVAYFEALAAAEAQANAERAAAEERARWERLSGPPVAPDSYWDRMAYCETAGNWAHFPYGTWTGGLGIYNQTWLGWGGGEFAPKAGQATREQQIIVANRIATLGYNGLGPVGYSAWGCLAAVGYP